MISFWFIIRHKLILFLSSTVSDRESKESTYFQKWSRRKINTLKFIFDYMVAKSILFSIDLFCFLQRNLYIKILPKQINIFFFAFVNFSLVLKFGTGFSNPEKRLSYRCIRGTTKRVSVIKVHDFFVCYIRQQAKVTKTWSLLKV